MSLHQTINIAWLSFNEYTIIFISSGVYFLSTSSIFLPFFLSYLKWKKNISKIIVFFLLFPTISCNSFQTDNVFSVSEAKMELSMAPSWFFNSESNQNLNNYLLNKIIFLFDALLVALIANRLKKPVTCAFFLNSHETILIFEQFHSQRLKNYFSKYEK